MLAAAPLVFSWMAPTPVLHRIGVRAAVNRMQAIDDHVTNTHMDDEMHRMHRKVMTLTSAVREAEKAVGAASVLAEMEVIDMAEVLRETEKAKEAMAADLLEAQLENKRLTEDLHTSKQESIALCRANEELSTVVRLTSSDYQVGMPFTHSLSLCLAHARTALTAARADVAWQFRRVGFRVQDLLGVIVYRSLVYRVRLMLMVRRVLDNWKEQKKLQRSAVVLADPTR